MEGLVAEEGGRYGMTIGGEGDKMGRKVVQGKEHL